MLLKAAGVLLVAAGVVAAGFEEAGKRNRCAWELEQFVRLLRFSEQEITGRRMALASVFAQAAAYTDGKACELGQELSARLNENGCGFLSLWESLIDRLYAEYPLSQAELCAMKQAGKAFLLPQKDLIGSQSRMDQEILWRMCGERREHLAADCRLIRCLSVMAGLFLTVLLL